MKCSNCGNEVDQNTAYCPFCGTKVDAEPAQAPVQPVQEPVAAPVQEPIVEQPVQPTYQEPVQEQPVQAPVQEPVYEHPVKVTLEQPVVEQPVQQAQPAQQTQTTYQASPKTSTTSKEGNRRSLITIICIVAAVALVACILCLTLFGSKSPEKIYKGLISEAVNEAIAGESVTANSAKVTMSLETSTNIDEMKDVLDGARIAADVQYDRAAQQAVVALDVEKGRDKYLNLKAMGDLANEYVVVGEENLFSKLIKAEIPEEFYDELEDYLGKDYTFEVDAAARKKAAKILNSTLEDNMKDEWFSKEKITTQENGKLTDNMLTIRETELEDFVIAVVKSLRVNNDFLSCFADRDEIVDILDGIEDEFDGMSDEDVVYTFHIYNKSFNKFVGAAVVQKDEYYDREEIVEVEKKSKKEYEIRVEENRYGELEVIQTIDVVVNKLNKNDADVEINMDIEDVGYIKLNVVVSAVYNKGIELLDASSAVDYEDLTEDDMQEIMDNLENSPIYDIVEDYITPTTTSSDRTIPSGLTLLPGQSFVESYDDDIIVFNVPNSFEEDYGGSSYVRFSKEDKTKYTAYIDVDCEWDSLDEYRDEIENLLDWYTEEDGYSKVSLSKEETVEVGDYTFYKRVFKYTYGSYTTIRTYYYTPITDEYTYAVEIDDDDQIVTESEIEKLLTIDVTLAK